MALRPCCVACYSKMFESLQDEKYSIYHQNFIDMYSIIYRYIYIYMLYMHIRKYMVVGDRYKDGFSAKPFFWVGKDHFKALCGLETGWHSQI